MSTYEERAWNAENEVERLRSAFKREQEAVYTLTESLKRAEAERDALRALLAEAQSNVRAGRFTVDLDNRIDAALREGK